MGGDPVFTALLIGLGIDTLSMTPPLIPAVKYIVRATSMADAKKLAAKVLAMDSAKEVYAACEAFYRARVSLE